MAIGTFESGDNLIIALKNSYANLDVLFLGYFLLDTVMEHN